MKIQLFPYKLFYRYPFKIAHTERAFTPALYILLSYKGHFAWGEAVFPPYYSEHINTAFDFFTKITLPTKIEDLDIFSYSEELTKYHPNNIFAIAALDIALNSLKATVLARSLNELINVPLSKKGTSFTLGISPKTIMEKKITENPGITYFKLKVDQNEIGRILEDYCSITDKPFVVDANQGFTSYNEALFWAKELNRLKVEYLEQPFPKDDFQSHQKLKEACEIPIIADESFQKTTSLKHIKESFNGVNVKLMKAGGLSVANNIINKVNTEGLKIVLGCMSESSLGIKVAECLKSKADWVDLDGHLLISNDPFSEAKSVDIITEKLTKNI